MKAKAFYSKEDFGIKVNLKDWVYQDMDDQMLDKVDEFERQLNEKAWAMFVDFLNIPNSYFKKHNDTKPPVARSLPLDDEKVSEPIQNALYATGKMTTDDCEIVADGILLYLKDAGFEIVQINNDHSPLKVKQ